MHDAQYTPNRSKQCQSANIRQPKAYKDHEKRAEAASQAGTNRPANKHLSV